MTFYLEFEIAINLKNKLKIGGVTNGRLLPSKDSYVIITLSTFACCSNQEQIVNFSLKKKILCIYILYQYRKPCTYPTLAQLQSSIF